MPTFRSPHYATLSHDDFSGGGQDLSEPARIVIVEDDFLVASQMRDALTDAGFDIVGVASFADQALEIVDLQRPMLVIMDIRLGGARDGIDVALEVWATYGIRCIFATAHQDAEARARARPANPLAWIVKPYAMGSLVETVRRTIRELQRYKK